HGCVDFGRACAHAAALRHHNRGATNGPKLGVGPAHDRKSPDPVLQRSKSSQPSLTSLAKLRLIPPRSRTGAMHPNWLIFGGKLGGGARSPLGGAAPLPPQRPSL